MTRKAVTIGGLTVQPGTREHGYMDVAVLAGGTQVRLPIQVFHGVFDGPRICLESGMHGWEPMGTEILRRALLRVDPAKLRGTIVCLPLTQPQSIEYGGSVESTGTRTSPADQLDLNKVWPGKHTNAWLTERVAAVNWDVIKNCEAVVDYHDGTGACNELPVAFPQIFPAGVAVTVGGEADGTGGGGQGVALTEGQRQELNAKVLAMAKAFGSTAIWIRDKSPFTPTMLNGCCMINGIPCLVVEAGGGSQLDETIEPSVECTLNMLKHFGMIDGELILPKRQIMVDHYYVFRSYMGGFFIPEPGYVMGGIVTKGQLLGKVLDPFTSEVKEECISPVNGWLISTRIKMPINPGGYIAHIADTDRIVWESG